MNLTAQQQTFVDAVVARERNIALIARAGTGKTSTILSAVDALRASSAAATITVCAYNKSIADEVSAKLKARGHDDWKLTIGQTAHSMGNSLVAFAFRRPAVEPNKVRKLAWAILDNPNVQGDWPVVTALREYGSSVVELVSKAKQEGVGFFDDAPIASVDTWARIAEHYDINGLDQTDVMDDVIAAAQHLYKASLAQTDVIDYDDQILFPLVKNLRVKFTRDVIFVDEYQDISRARQALIRKFLAPGGQIHAIGDDRQAIYGFSGADANALPNFIEQMNALKLPLTVTWRCPQKVVRLAQQIVPDLEAAPGAAEGAVVQVGIETLDSYPFTPGQALLCRNTAPLVAAAYGLIRRGIGCKVEGKDIGAGLAKLARRWKVETIEQLVPRLEDYRATEIQKALAKGSEQKAESVADKVDTLLEVAAACQKRNRHDVADLLAAIEDMFGDTEKVTKPLVVLASYHRAKGREWPDVFLIEHAQRCPSKAARQAWQLRQEQNLSYVALTRAMRSLTFVG